MISAWGRINREYEEQNQIPKFNCFETVCNVATIKRCLLQLQLPQFYQRINNSFLAVPQGQTAPATAEKVSEENNDFYKSQLSLHHFSELSGKEVFKDLHLNSGAAMK